MYKSREDFLLDVNLIVENSRLYNGMKVYYISDITHTRDNLNCQ